MGRAGGLIVGAFKRAENDGVATLLIFHLIIISRRYVYTGISILKYVAFAVSSCMSMETISKAWLKLVEAGRVVLA